MLLKQKAWLIGLIQASAMTLYTVFLYFTFFSFMRSIASGSSHSSEILVTSLVLLVLVASVIISGLFTLALPGYFFLQNNYKKSIDIVIYTVLFLVFIVFTFIISLLMLNIY